MISQIIELGDAIDWEWDKRGRRVEDFPSICRSHLENADLSGLKASDFLDLLFSNVDVEQDGNLNFGEPSLRIYQTEDFYIQALFWFDSSTAIHAHSFAGAFYAVEGERICTTWSFQEHRWLADPLCIGELTRKKTELLQPGEIRCIEPASDGIHQIFHLGRPSVTLVVRTFRDKRFTPQLAYLPPGIAFFSSEDPVVERRIQYLRGALRADHPSFLDYLQKFIDSFDEPAIEFMLYYFCLNQPSAIGEKGHRIAGDAILRKYGPDALSAAEASAHERIRSNHIINVRARFPERHLRIFLAWLMLVESRDEILSLVSDYFEGDSPLDLVYDWSLEIARRTDVGIEFDEVNSFLFRHLLADAQTPEWRAEAIDEWGAEAIEANWADLLKQADTISRNRFFRPLLRASRYERKREAEAAA